MPRTGENIYRRKDGRWEARFLVPYQAEGKPKYRSVYAKSYTAAKKKLKEAEQEWENRSDCIQEVNVRMEQIAERWLSNIRMKVKESTYSRYCNLLYTHILPKLGKIKAEQFNTELAEQFIGGLLQKGRKDGNGGLSAKTVRDIFVVLKEIIHYGQQSGIEITCKLDNIILKREKKEKSVLSAAEQKRLVRYLMKEPEPCKAGVILCLYTGIRIGELCALCWREIDLQNRILSVKYTMQRIQNYLEEDGAKTKIIRTSPKSVSSIRRIPLPQYLIDLLRPWEAHPDAFFLSGEKGQIVEPRSMQFRFKSYLRESNIQEVNFHCLRHTFSTNSMRVGMDTKTLSELLGHASASITMNEYVHSSMEFKIKSMEKLFHF
jgi:integrase